MGTNATEIVIAIFINGIKARARPFPNLGMWQAEVGAAPHKTVGLRATYYHMGAFHPFAG